MKISDHFDARELVDPWTWERIGARAASFIDPRLLEMLEVLREFTGPIRVNDWHRGGQYRCSGLRGPGCEVGNPYSSHRFGTTADIKTPMPPEGVVAVVFAHPEQFPYVIRVENPVHTPTWTHIECGIRGDGVPIYMFNP